ncbi:TPA: ead/Ea22-like family protein [Enterobacter hormaechei]
MSNIEKLMEKLKSAAIKLNCEQWQTRNGFSGVEVIVKGSVAKGHGCVSYQPVASELVDAKTAKAIALFCPANILALLDELEAAEQRNAELVHNHRVHAARLIDERGQLKQRIAELEAKLQATDKLHDSAFRHGLQHGFSYGQTDDQAGFEQAIQAYGQQWKGE